MEIFETIRRRRSVRTFDSTPLSTQDAQDILAFANTADNPYQFPITWKLLSAKETGLSSPVIVGADTFLAGKLPHVPFAEEAFGYSMERIVLFAESHGIGTTWIAGTMDRSAFEQAVGLTENEIMPCITPLGYPADKMSLRESLMRKGVKADTRLPFGELFFDGAFESPLSPEKAGKLKEALECVRLAPSAVNKQPWRVAVCGDRVHFFEKKGKMRSGEGWDVQKVDLGIALCHFALAAQECGLRAVFQQADPGFSVDETMHYIATYVIA